MKSKNQRINNIIGQLIGVSKMLDSKADCLSVLTQLKAIKSAVGKVMDEVVEDQFETCLSALNKKDREVLTKIKSYVKGS